MKLAYLVDQPVGFQNVFKIFATFAVPEEIAPESTRNYAQKRRKNRPKKKKNRAKKKSREI
jgi:hypothetical protein